MVAVIVLVICYKLGRRAIDVLLDKAPHGTIILVKNTLAEFPAIKHFHSLKVRTAGADTFIKVNIHLEPDLSLLQVHEICDTIEKEIGSRIDRSEVYIHAEPEDIRHIQNEIPDDL